MVSVGVYPAGAFLLTDHCDELKEIFDVGTEIETYENSSELYEKVKYYSENDIERNEIALRGYEKYRQEFTRKKRVEELIKQF
ncbi:MAG: glycosyltransferase [Lentisphaerales bacterium]|nr:glycosyltransferase [Lentisphaerales bacterium]